MAQWILNWHTFAREFGSFSRASFTDFQDRDELCFQSLASRKSDASGKMCIVGKTAKYLQGCKHACIDGLSQIWIPRSRQKVSQYLYRKQAEHANQKQVGELTAYTGLL